LKRSAKTIISYALPAIIVMVLGLIILAVQGIWPFGRATIDFYDMGQQVAAETVQIWDEMHGAKSMFFDWYTRFGRAIPGGTYLSLGNLVLYFVPRDMILEAFSLILIFRMMCMSFSMRIFLKKTTPECPDFYSILFCVGYAFCGYVLMNYTIMGWMNTVIIIPLLLLFLKNLLSKGKGWGFIICLTLLCVDSFYVATIFLLFAFLGTGLYSVIYRDKKLHVLRLCLALVSSLIFSAWSWIPKMFSITGGQRFENGTQGTVFNQYYDILSHVEPDYATRWWCLLGVSFLAAVSAVGLIRDIKSKNYKRFAFFGGCFAMVLVQLLFESTHLLLHFGSYVNYPVRNGFFVYIAFAFAAAFYAKDILNGSTEALAAEKKTSRVKVFRRGMPIGYQEEVKTGLNSFIGGGMIFTILCAGLGIYWYRVNAGMSIYMVFRISMLVVMAAFLIYLFLILFKKGRYAKLYVFVFLAELIFYGVLLIGKPLYITGYSEEPEQQAEYVHISQQLRDELGIYESRLDRIKNPDTSLNTNYGMFLKRATLAAWMPDVSGDVLSSAADMGYSTHFTRTLDAGGTVFSDALFHVTQVVSLKEQDNTLYNKVAKASVTVNSDTDESAEYGLYNCRFVLPFGTIINELPDLKDDGSSAVVDNYNSIYRVMSRNNTDADDGIAGEITVTVDGEALEFDGHNNDVHVDGQKALYISSRCNDMEQGNAEIVVNDSIISIPTITDYDNTLYPAHFNNSCVYMGTFADEDVSFRIDRDNSFEAQEYNFTVFTIDIDKLETLCRYYTENHLGDFRAGKSSFEAEVIGKDGEYLMLPIAYNKDFTITNNGITSNAVPVDSLLFAIPLKEGFNSIRIEYHSGNMTGYLLLAVIFAMLVATAYYITNLWQRKNSEKYLFFVNKRDTFEQRADKTIRYIMNAVWGLSIVGVYLVPALYGIYYYVCKLL